MTSFYHPNSTKHHLDSLSATFFRVWSIRQAYNGMFGEFEFKLDPHADDLLDRCQTAGVPCHIIGRLRQRLSSALGKLTAHLHLSHETEVQVCHVPDHDYVFWMGDLNARVALDGHQVRDDLAKGNLSLLLQVWAPPLCPQPFVCWYGAAWLCRAL